MWLTLAWWAGCVGPGEPEAAEATDVSPTPQAQAEADCRGGDATQCVTLAHLLRKEDAGRAAELFSQACGQGAPEGCVALAEMHASGNGLPRDPARSAALYGQACEADHRPACHELAGLHLEGRGVEADVERAVELYGGACSAAFAPSCRSLSEIYELGARVPRDVAQAKSFAKAGCGHGDGVACARLAERQILDGEDRDARSTLDALLKRDPELETVDALVVRGLQLAAGEKASKVGPELLMAWRSSRAGESEWSWKALSAHLADERRKKSRVSRIVIELLDAPRADGTEAALTAALGLPG